MDRLHKSFTSQTHQALKAKKAFDFLLFLSPLERKNPNGRVGGVKEWAASLTELVGFVHGFHRVAVILREETPGGAVLVHRAPAASSPLTARLVAEVKGQRGLQLNPGPFKTTWIPSRLQPLDSSPLSLQRGSGGTGERTLAGKFQKQETCRKGNFQVFSSQSTP